jgi:hypothetical protein
MQATKTSTVQTLKNTLMPKQAHLQQNKQFTSTALHTTIIKQQCTKLTRPQCTTLIYKALALGHTLTHSNVQTKHA